MKTLYMMVTVIIVMLAVCAQSFSQVTLTEAEVNSAFTNHSWQQQSDSLSAAFNLGNASSGQTWDFSSIQFYPHTGKRDTNNYLPVAGKPGAASFPNATQCIYQVQSQSAAGYTVTFALAEYFSVTSNAVSLLGLAEHITTSPTPAPPFPYPADTLIIGPIHPAEIVLTLPLTGSSATFSTIDTTYNGNTTTVNGIDYRRNIPAGDGTVKFPGGDVKNVVRLILVDSAVTITTGQPNTVKYKTAVNFTATDGSSIDFTVPTGYTSGSVNPSSYEMTTSLGPLDVKQVKNVVPEHFNLAQNYPNPFNPTTTIAFDLPKEDFVTVKVYDMLGREVATLVNQRLTPGSYQTSFNGANYSSGMYLYRVQAGNFLQTKTMMLIK